MPSSPDDAIIADSLVKHFGDVHALNGVSLSVPTGTVLGLLGPNGAGKTTAVRMLTTILPIDGGSARVLGVDVAKEPARVRGLIGLAGQYAAVDEKLTGRENLRMMSRLTHQPKAGIAARGAELLHFFDLTEAADRPVGTYSGGMRRRLDLAASLVHHPPVLFLDEPTTGLDPASRNDLWGVIEGLVAEGTTLLLTTQYLEEADRLADNIAVIDHGGVIAEGTAAALKSSMGSTIVEAVFPDPDTARRAAGVLAAIATAPPDVVTTGVTLKVDDGTAAMFQLVRALDAEDIPAESVTVREPTLDDVFLSLTGHTATSEDEEEASGVTTISAPAMAATATPTHEPNMIARWWSDTKTIVWRNLINIRRTPQLLVFSTIQPVIFVLMFRYVFGGAIHITGVPYVDYLMPGIFAQTIVFGAIGTGVGLAEDLSKGLVERFRSLPMARSAVLVGRSVADLSRNVFVVLLMVFVGYLVGFRIHDGVAKLGLGIVVLLFFGFALSWIFAILGLLTKNAEATQAAAFPVLAPLVFASNAFVPLNSMPAWLQAFARNQPVSITVAAVRRLVLGYGSNPAQAAHYRELGMVGSTWVLVFKALLWAAGIVAVFAPLAVRMYRQAT